MQQATLAKSEDPDKMPHNALFAKIKSIFRERNTIFKKHNLIQGIILISLYDELCGKLQSEKDLRDVLCLLCPDPERFVRGVQLRRFFSFLPFFSC